MEKEKNQKSKESNKDSSKDLEASTPQVRVLPQPTPNPHAYKFITSEDLKLKGKVTFHSPSECVHVPLAYKIMTLPYVLHLHIFENFLTITQDGSSPWEEVIDQVKDLLLAEIPKHNPDFKSSEDLRRESLDPALRKIEEILDSTIRPSLQADGGDIEVLSLEGNTLRINYEGACGSCPSSLTGTLEAIISILREEFHPSIEVIPENTPQDMPGYW